MIKDITPPIPQLVSARELSINPDKGLNLDI